MKGESGFPFFIRGPGIPAGIHSEIQVTGNDIYPTILDMAGHADGIPPRVEGVSLLPLLRSGGNVELQRPDPLLIFKHSKPKPPWDATLIQGDFKWICNLAEGKGYLFNLREDIGERLDIQEQYPEKAEAMHKALMEYLHEQGWKIDLVRKGKKRSEL